MPQIQHSVLSADEQAQILAIQQTLSAFQRALLDKPPEQGQSSPEPKSAITTAFLKLVPLVFVRPSDLRCARWAEIDLEGAEWRFTADNTGKPHIIPLAVQAADILRGLHPVTGNGEFVFPSINQPEHPISEMAMQMAVRKRGLNRASLYDFRRMAEMILGKALRFPPDCIASQMGHPISGETERIYNRARCAPEHRLPERKAMMQAWADWLDGLNEGGDAVAMAA